MKALKVTSSDSLCVEAGWGKDTPDSFVAVPDIYQKADLVEVVYTKHSSDFLRLRIDSEYVEIKLFEEDTPESAINSAKEELVFEGYENSEDLNFWNR